MFCLIIIWSGIAVGVVLLLLKGLEYLFNINILGVAKWN